MTALSPANRPFSSLSKAFTLAGQLVQVRLQPVYADDVAAAIAQILRQSQKPYPVYELAGPRVYACL